MRTTITFDDDVAAALARRRGATHGGLSATVNDLVRAGLRAESVPDDRPFVQMTDEIGLRVDVTSVADALEQLDGPASR